MKNIILIGNKTALWIIEKILKDIPTLKVIAESETNLGMQGIQTLVELQPDVVILLLDIPQLRTFDVARKLHEMTTAKLILISVIDDEHYRIQAKEAGAQEFLLASEAIAKLPMILNSNTDNKEHNN